MSDERKKLCLCVGINFTIGIIMGILLFFSHLRSNPVLPTEEYMCDTTIHIIDVVRVWWVNMLWCFSALIAHSILPVSAVHIIVGCRGVTSAFSAMYMLETAGMKAAAASVLPQCLSAVPMLMFFSLICVEKRRRLQKEGKEPFVINRNEVYVIFVISAAVAVVEAAFFMILCRFLF